MLSEKKNQWQKGAEKISRLEQQVQDLEKLTGVLDIFWSATRVEEVIQRIIEETLALCHADQGSIVLLAPQTNYQAKTLVRRGISVDQKLDHFLNELLTGWVSHHKTMLVTDDLVETFGEKNIKEKYSDIRSVFSIPLIIENNLIGVFNLVSERRGFGEREKQLMKVLAPHCAQFIRNAQFHQRLFAETRRLRSEIQEKYAIHGIIGRSPAMQEVFSLNMLTMILFILGCQEQPTNGPDKYVIGGIVVDETQNFPRNTPPGVALVFFIDSTRAFNLRCVYCFHHPQEKVTTISEAALTEIIDYLQNCAG